MSRIYVFTIFPIIVSSLLIVAGISVFVTD